jgi:hypothetical protein
MFIGPSNDFVEWASRLHDMLFRGHQHYVTNVLIDLDGDEAHAETYVMVVAGDKEGWGHSMNGGRYIDRLERRDGRWAIVDRVVSYEWSSNVAAMQMVTEVSHQFSQDRSDPSYTRPLRVTREDRDLAAGMQMSGDGG